RDIHSVKSACVAYARIALQQVRGRWKGMTPVSDRAVTEQKIALSPNTVRSIVRIQVFTIIWMSVEGAVSLVAAGRASSPALLGFGGDSVIELLSAAVVFLRFQSESNQEKAERWAAKVAGALLLALGGCVVL